MMDNQGMQGMMCKCPHHNMKPLLVVLFGLDFLGGAMGWWGIDFVNVSWPILVIIAGVMKMTEGKCKCC